MAESNQAVQTGKNIATKKAAGKVAGIATKAAGRMASGFTKSAIGALGKMAAGFASGGASVAAQIGLTALQNADKLAKNAAGLAGAAMGLISGGVSVAMGSAWSSFGIALVAVPLVVGSFLVIINTGAYIVPPDFGGLGIDEIDVPDGCPAKIWPVSTGSGERYFVNQGPGGPSSHGPCVEGIRCTLNLTTGEELPPYEAIDIHPNDRIGRGKLIIASHPGTVLFSGSGIAGGLTVSILDNCGTGFQSRYVHMQTLNVRTGDVVEAGTVLGVMGCTGYCGSTHLHYEFRQPNGTFTIRPGSSPPYMSGTYLPSDVPYRCLDRTSNPCNVSIQ